MYFKIIKARAHKCNRKDNNIPFTPNMVPYKRKYPVSSNTEK